MIYGKSSSLVLPIQEHARVSFCEDISQFSLLPTSPYQMEFCSAVAFGKAQASAAGKHGRSTCFYLSYVPIKRLHKFMKLQPCFIFIKIFNR